MKPDYILNLSASCYLRKVCLPQGEESKALVHFLAINWEFTEISPKFRGMAVCLFKAQTL